jgi:hypothetical protein
MGKISFILLLVFILGCLGYWYALNPDEKLDRDIVCRQCRKRGRVYIKSMKKKSGVLTEAHCYDCNATWRVQETNQMKFHEINT